MSGNPLRVALNSTPLFHAKRNRVELISDFAPNNDADLISSLQLHPQGWVAVSRNVSSDENSEWCCVHDIQGYPLDEKDDVPVGEATENRSRMHRQQQHQAAAADDPASASGSSERRSGGGYVRLAEFLQSVAPVDEASFAARIDAGEVRQHVEDDEGPARRQQHQDEQRQGASRPAAEVRIRVRQESEGNGAANSENQRQRQEGVIVQDMDSQRRERFRDLLHILNTLPRGEGVQQPQVATVAGPTTSHQAQQEQDQRQPESQRRSQSSIDRRPSQDSSSSDSLGDDDEENQGFLLIPPNPGSGSGARVFYFGGSRASRRREPPLPDNAKIHYNVKRLTHFIQESNQVRFA